MRMRALFVIIGIVIILTLVSLPGAAISKDGLLAPYTNPPDQGTYDYADHFFDFADGFSSPFYAVPVEHYYDPPDPDAVPVPLWPLWPLPRAAAGDVIYSKVAARLSLF
jgi:hypothetical protein